VYTADLSIANYPVYAVAVWTSPAYPGPGVETHEWLMATKDNRRSRVLARIRSRGIPCDEETLVIVNVHP
jgi:hypothetical protein